MADPRSPDFKPVIETVESDPKEWTPAKGLFRGMTACLIVGALMGAAWITLSCSRPDVTIFHIHEDAKVTFFLVVIGILTGFVMTWILFAIMHRMSRMVGWPCVAGVVMTALLIVTARQIAIAVSGITLEDLDVTGWAWLGPRRFLISNVGVWIGLGAAVYLFHEGESFVDLFPSSS